MDILYYSNYCKHSQKILQYITKGNLANQMNFICVDKRTRDPRTNQLLIVLENGKTIMMPPNVQSVPALLQVKKNYQVILGEDIIGHLQPRVVQQKERATSYNGEPVGFPLPGANLSGGVNILSEPYTMYNLSTEELSAKGRGGNRPMYNYVSANHDQLSIVTPPDTYEPDKVAEGVTIDGLQQQRNSEVPQPPMMNSAFLP
jgi:hypothetical protein